MLKSSPKSNLCIFTASFFLYSAELAYAQTPRVNLNNVSELEAVFDCKTELDPMKRLSCYDTAVGRFETAQQKGDVVTISKQQVEEVERDSFGFNIPSLPKLSSLFNGRKDDLVTNTSKERDNNKQTSKQANTQPHNTVPKGLVDNINIKELESAILKTQTFGYKKIRFFLENGQVWEQLDGKTIRIPKERGGVKPSANIKSGSFGGFLLSINGKGGAIRVRRVR